MGDILAELTKRASPGVTNPDDPVILQAASEHTPPDEYVASVENIDNALKEEDQTVRECPPNTVFLNVYDLDEQFVSVNNALSNVFSGAYHAGIECYGVEYCYGMTEEARSGVYWHKPKRNPMHLYRRTHKLGETSLSKDAFKRLMSSKAELWVGNEYHLFRKNCISFCVELADDLQVIEEFPNYVSSLMNTASNVADGYIQAAELVHDLGKQYSNTVDYVGDGIVNKISKASDEFSKLTDGIRAVIPSFFGLTYPESDDEVSPGDNIHSIPSTVESLMSIPSSVLTYYLICLLILSSSYYF